MHRIGMVHGFQSHLQARSHRAPVDEGGGMSPPMSAVVAGGCGADCMRGYGSNHAECAAFQPV
uniref:Uncharacterized protein n=1 Tax=Candidatus Methanogaster sp. ANME-2c ERB4 TaxID=2759911 RepID=A0A7G9YCD3_9EURY|nr:hypothetical protein LOFKPPND_00005 [Methanosarcinales archaeon ANME-2c ERB4]QNO47872.1 hypothetical protein DJFEGNLO_00026 [Methanosarcinales archaeon ANME-2c ERB4]